VAGGAVDGWEQTLAGLVAGSGAALKRHAFLLCGDEAEADDLVQEALVRAFARSLRVPRARAAEAYVRVIMVNLFIDGARRHSRWAGLHRCSDRPAWWRIRPIRCPTATPS
jgi:DNA-directed RNA polymerase specialized sigma24 family protein